jgi:signal transduction histidine kinase
VSSIAGRFAGALPRFERVERGRVVAGVCSGIAETLSVDPVLVRLTFALLAFASGAGILAYLGAWALLPAPGAAQPSRFRRITGTVLLVWSAVLALRGLGLSDRVVWPLALAAAGLAVLSGAVPGGLDDRRARIGGIVLVVLGTAFFLERNTHGNATTLLAPGAAVVALLLVVGPWAWRLSRERDAERAERIRTQERAELVARVHDSVLQTLALIQRVPDDPRRVSTLARRQERELRAWLYPEREPAAPGTLAAALDVAVAEIEEVHAIRVELVRTGDVPADERVRALVLAAREALANAAKHAGVEEVSVFVEASPERVALYVRDRGGGFDPDSVPADRRGIAHSIRERMERVGGSARIVSSPGEGTEVELDLPGRVE